MLNPGGPGPLWDTTSYADHLDPWHHLLATWDAATGRRAIYMDGAEIAADTIGPAAPYYDGSPTRIGADTNNNAYDFHLTVESMRLRSSIVPSLPIRPTRTA